MDNFVASAFNLGLASAIALAETCDTYDEVITELNKWLEERKALETKNIPVTHIQATPYRVKVKIS